MVTRFRLGRNSFNFTSSSLVTHIYLYNSIYIYIYIFFPFFKSYYPYSITPPRGFRFKKFFFSASGYIIKKIEAPPGKKYFFPEGTYLFSSMIHLLKGYMKTLRKISKVSLTPPGVPSPSHVRKKIFF